MNNNTRIITWIGISLLIAVLMTIVPLPHWVILLQPQWLFVIVLFWVMKMPEYCGIIAAWFVGLLMDCVTGTLLGLHSLIFSLAAYFVLKWPAPIIRSPLWQQMSVVLLFASLNVFLQRFILSINGETISSRVAWFSVITTVLIWPVVSTVLKRAEKQSIVYHS